MSAITDATVDGPTVGVVGVGNIGSPLAINLAKSGYRTMAFDIDRDAMDSVEAEGVISATDVGQLASEAGIILTSLPHPEISRSVYLGKDGLIAGASKGTILVETSTIPPAVVKGLHDAAEEEELRFLEACVLGGVGAVQEARLTFVVGGDAGLLEDVRTVLGSLSSAILWAGEIGMGNTAKIVNNAVSHANMAVLSEAVAFGARLGLDANLLARVLSSGLGDSAQVHARLEKRIMPRDFEGGASIDIIKKDSEFALALAEDIGMDATVLKAAHENFVWASNEGLGHLDYAALVIPWERNLGVQVSRGED